jgi:hypothetical protein
VASNGINIREKFFELFDLGVPLGALIVSGDVSLGELLTIGMKKGFDLTDLIEEDQITSIIQRRGYKSFNIFLKEEHITAFGIKLLDYLYQKNSNSFQAFCQANWLDEKTRREFMFYLFKKGNSNFRLFAQDKRLSYDDCINLLIHLYKNYLYSLQKFKIFHSLTASEIYDLLTRLFQAWEGTFDDFILAHLFKDNLNPNIQDNKEVKQFMNYLFKNYYNSNINLLISTGKFSKENLISLGIPKTRKRTGKIPNNNNEHRQAG